MGKYISSSLARRLSIYPRPKFFAMFEADRVLKGMANTPMKKAELLNDIFEHYYRNKSEGEQQRLLAKYDEMMKQTKKPK